MNILIGITSSIASYKIYELIRLFKRNNHNVKVVLTKNALEFVSPLVLETLSGDKCYYKQFEARENVEHIHLVDWADVFVVAPLSANTLSKFANGISDNLLTSVFCAYLGSKKPILIAPAMNTNMYQNPIIQKNLDILKEYADISPVKLGFLACGSEGIGRMCEIDEIYHRTLRLYHQKKENNSKKMVITIGGTREMIDTVRCISNLSSGKMGTALSDWAYYKGYDVCAISTVELDRPYEVKKVATASDVLEELKQTDFDYLIMASAICDFKPKTTETKKISKENFSNLELEKNPDIIATIAENKKDNQVIMGFCLADDDLIQKAQEKLRNKNLDFIVANSTNALNNDKNRVTIINKSGRIDVVDTDTKENIAKKILEVAFD